MCGIAGFIGESKNYKLTFRLITALFEESQIRGTDAAGYWGTQTGDGVIVYHKEPIKASEFVKKPVWRDLSNINLNLLLVHARGASSGVGAPSDNKNNHPFTSTCKSIGLVHNGRIPDLEYDVLTKRYEVISQCDSELLLRIFEGGQQYSPDDCHTILEAEDAGSDIYHRLMGLRDIWSYIDKGHMAVAIGERVDTDERRLFLFRNRYRSLWLADMREELGQVFFCSTTDIWNNSYRNSGLSRVFNRRVKMVELPTEELWMLSCDQNGPISDIKKYDICTNGKLMWKPEGELIKVYQKAPVAEILTKLSDNEQVQSSKKANSRTTNNSVHCDVDDDDEIIDMNDYDDLNLGIDDLQTSCATIERMLGDLFELAGHKISEGRLSASSLKELLREMESIELQIDGSIRLLKQ